MVSLGFLGFEYYKNSIGLCYMHLGETDIAEKLFGELIKDLPDWELPLLDLGRVYLEQEKFYKALQCFEKAKELNKNNEDVYYYLGVYYITIKDYEKAISCYEKSLSLNDEQSDVYLNLGLCYLRLKEFDKSIYYSKKAFELDNTDMQPLHNKAIVLGGQGEDKGTGILSCG